MSFNWETTKNNSGILIVRVAYSAKVDCKCKCKLFKYSFTSFYVLSADSHEPSFRCEHTLFTIPHHILLPPLFDSPKKLKRTLECKLEVFNKCADLLTN